MGDHPHDAGNLGRCGDTSDLTLGAQRGRQSILIGLEDGRLMQANGRGVDVHVQKDDVGVGQTVGEPEMTGHGERDVKQDVVYLSMSLPEIPVEIVLTIVRTRAM